MLHIQRSGKLALKNSGIRGRDIRHIIHPLKNQGPGMGMDQEYWPKSLKRDQGSGRFGLKKWRIRDNSHPWSSPPHMSKWFDNQFSINKHTQQSTIIVLSHCYCVALFWHFAFFQPWHHLLPYRLVSYLYYKFSVQNVQALIYLRLSLTEQHVNVTYWWKLPFFIKYVDC